MAHVSVIIPVYNVKQYLPQCVEYVVKKSKYNIEILLVDDGSTDGSEKLCDEYASTYENVKVIHKENGGLGSARNAGVKAATGEYILYLDSDDYISVDAIDELYARASSKHLDIVLFGATGFFEDEKSAVAMPKSNYCRKCCIDNVCSGLELIIEEQKHKGYITSVCLRMYRRDYLIAGGYKFNESIIHEDIDYSFFTLLNAEKVESCDKNYYYRRYRQGSIIMSSRLQKRFTGCEYAWNEFMKYLNTKDLDQRKKLATIKRSEVDLRVILSVVSEMEKKDRKTVKPRLKKIVKVAKTYKKYYRKSTLASLYFPNLYASYMRFKPRILTFKKFIRMIYSEPLFLAKLGKIGRKTKKARIYLLGTPIHGNAGDHLIALAEKQFIKKYYPDKKLIDCSMSFTIFFGKFIKKHVTGKDLVLISGGGWLGTEWPHNEIFVRDKLRGFQNNCVVILPQTVFYAFENSFLEEGKEVYSNHECLIFCLREELSKKFVEDSGLANASNTLLLPDFAMLYQDENAQLAVEADAAKICFRNDLEKAMATKELERVKEIIINREGTVKAFDTVKRATIPLMKRQKYVNSVLREVREAKYVVTDRLHAMIMCALVGTPCIAYDNTTHKVKNVYKWLETLSYIHVMDEKDELSNVIAKISETDRAKNISEFKSLQLECYYENLINMIDAQKGTKSNVK